jgi:hypothetical protein
MRLSRLKSLSCCVGVRVCVLYGLTRTPFSTARCLFRYSHGYYATPRVALITLGLLQTPRNAHSFLMHYPGWPHRHPGSAFMGLYRVCILGLGCPFNDNFYMIRQMDLVVFR